MRFLLVPILVFCFTICASQIPNYKITNYTVETGLPSNECHRILQDDRGYMWIATDRGLVKFDGYDFKVFGLKEGLTNPSVLELFYSKPQQKLFMLSFGNEVFEMNLKSEEIRKFECQDAIDTYSSRFRVAEMQMSEFGEIYFDIDGYGVLKLNSLCESEILEIDKQNYQFNHLGIFKLDNASAVTYNKTYETGTFKKLDFEFYKSGKDENGSGVLLFENLKYVIPSSDRFPLNSQAKSFVVNDSLLLCSIIGYDVFILNEKVIKINEAFQLRDIEKLQSGGYVAIRGDLGGVEFYQNIEDLKNQYKTYLIPNLSPSCVFEDRFQNIWITTLDEGFYKLSKNAFQNVLKSNREIDVTDVLALEDQIIYVEDQEKIYSTRDDENIPIFTSATKNLAEIKALSGNQFAAADRGSFIMNKNFTPSYITSNLPNYHNNLQAKMIRVFGDRIFWLSSSNFGYHNELDRKLSFDSNIDLKMPNYRVLDIEEVNRELYLLARKDGLYYFNDSIPRKIISDRPELNVRINSILKKDQWYFLATQGYGLVVWDLKDHLFSIKTDDGLCTDNTEEIYFQDEFIYVLSKVGLSQLKGDPINGFEIRCLNSKHGLPSNQINGLAERNDSLIIATNKGLVIFNQEIERSNTTIPIFENVSANNTIIVKDTSIHHSLNDIKYQFKTLDYSLYGDINYRYKLNDQEWNYTRSTTVDFPDLNPGFYSFQVQSQNTDGVWGDAEIFDFTIKKPWWQWLSVRVLFFILLAVLGYLIYHRRLRTLRKGFQIENEIRDLEKSALAAQMNPHFIFNCLNSIQNFVMKNEKETAMEYLGKFAQLIRGNLNASAESSLTLNDEIKMLRNYLELEQLRLNNSFDFDIEYDQILNTSEIEFPPMLIQPFVENAVVHGMKGVKEGGIIKVTFKKMGKNLRVSVFDNGSSENQRNLDKNHKSYGTKITQKRLAFINKMSEESITVSPYKTGEGSEVMINIKLN